MSHFYASIQGNRSERTCMGTENSGIEGHIRSWDFGIRVCLKYNPETKKNTAFIYHTSGSNGGKPDQLFAEIEEN